MNIGVGLPGHGDFHRRTSQGTDFGGKRETRGCAEAKIAVGRGQKWDENTRGASVSHSTFVDPEAGRRARAAKTHLRLSLHKGHREMGDASKGLASCQVRFGRSLRSIWQGPLPCRTKRGLIVEDK